MKHKFTKDECSKGGKNSAKLSGGACPRCPGSYFKTHAKLAGHLGLHGFADRFSNGDINQARLDLALTGAAATDPVPQNGAFARGHQILLSISIVENKPVFEYKSEKTPVYFDE